VNRLRLAAVAAAVLLASALAWTHLRSAGVDPIVPAARDVRSDSLAIWVYFDPDSTRSDAPPAISEVAAARRALHGIPAFENDRPIPPSLIARVEATGARVREQSRWLRAVSVWVDATALENLVAIPAVRALRTVGEIVPAGDMGSAVTMVSGIRGSLEAPTWAWAASSLQIAQDSAYYGPNWPVIRSLGVPQSHLLSFNGNGIRIAILDTGFEPRHQSLSGRIVLARRDFINNDTTVVNDAKDPTTVNQARHGTQVWSMIGGFVPGTLVGPAFNAGFILAKVKSELNNSRADEDRWVAAIEWATDSLGAALVASALTFRYDFVDRPEIQYGELNGDITATTRAADAAALRGVLVVSAIGDAGPAAGSLGAPADADSVLSVGAVDSLGLPAVFSSGSEGTARGPSADGRPKPEVVARGTRLFAASALSTTAYDIGLNGTSYSTAFIAGGAAMVMQAWPSLTSAAIRRAILLSADHSTTPDNATGYGVPDFASAIMVPDGIQPTSVTTVDVNNALTTLAPEFNWSALVHPSLRPIRYRLDVASDSLFTNIIYTDTITDAFTLTAKRAMRPAARRWWRIVGMNQARNVRRISPPAAQTFAVPGWVRLVTPDPTQVSFVNTTRPDFRWTPLTAPAPIGPLVYDVEVLSNETGLPAQSALRNLTTSTIRLSDALVPNTAYRWRVIARTQLGTVDTVESTNPFVVTSDTAPPATLLYQNFPNPFPNGTVGTTATQIWFDLADTATVELTVHDQRGRLVRRLIPASTSCGTVKLNPGIYGRSGPLEPAEPCVRTHWDGNNNDGRTVARGLYILRLRVNGRDFFKNMLFLPER
jgi:Subtilase family